MKTFNKKKKEEVLKIALEHQKQDRFVQGNWLRSEKIKGLFKGCFFGCMTQTDENTLSEASKKLHIPLWLVHVSEKIFEGLDYKESLTFPVELLKAIPTNNDLDKVWKQWNITVLTDQLRFVDKGSEQEKAIKEIINLYNTEKTTELASELAARSAVESAWLEAKLAEELAAKLTAKSAESLAWSIELAKAAWSAWSAARSAEWSARSIELTKAAWSAAELAARLVESAAKSEWLTTWSAESTESAELAKSNYYSFLKNTLIEILKEN